MKRKYLKVLRQSQSNNGGIPNKNENNLDSILSKFVYKKGCLDWSQQFTQNKGHRKTIQKRSIDKKNVPDVCKTYMFAQIFTDKLKTLGKNMKYWKCFTENQVYYIIYKTNIIGKTLKIITEVLIIDNEIGFMKGTFYADAIFTSRENMIRRQYCPVTHLAQLIDIFMEHIE